MWSEVQKDSGYDSAEVEGFVKPLPVVTGVWVSGRLTTNFAMRTPSTISSLASDNKTAVY